MRLIVLTGTSGAGKTTALRYFEDAGYYCADNLPPTLLEALAESAREAGRERVLAVVDSRAGACLSDLAPVIDDLSRKGMRPEVLFLDASDEVLVRRFKESRRPHPTFGTGRGTILEAVRAERDMLADILARSDRVVDTSGLSPAELRQELESTTRESLGKGLIVTVESFGFKHGIPIDADLVFDVRFLVNPHYVLALQPLVGTSPEVADYIHRHALTNPYMEKLLDFLLFTLPEYLREGKAYLTIAIGCTGGRHRSVTLAEDVASRLREEGYRTTVYHRDIDKAAGSPPEDAR